MGPEAERFSEREGPLLISQKRTRREGVRSCSGPDSPPMSVSLQQRLAEVAKEFEDQKFRQLDLYQRQLRKARDALHDKEVEVAEKVRELEDAKVRAEDAEAQCAAESQGSVDMTREIIAMSGLSFTEAPPTSVTPAQPCDQW